MEQVLHFTKKLYAFSGKILIINILGMVFISLIEGVGVLLLLPILNVSGIANVETGIPLVSMMIKYLQDLPKALSLPLVLCLFVFLVIGQNWLLRTLTIRDTIIQQKFVRHLRLETYTNLLQSNWSFFVNHRKSDLINLLTSELTRVGFGTTLVLQLVASLIFTLIQIGIAFWLSPVMTIFVLTFGVILTLFSRKFIKRAKSLGGQTSQLSQNFLAGISDQMAGMKDIKSNSLEDSWLRWYRSLTQNLVNEQVEYMKLRSSSQLFYKVASSVLIAVFVYLSVTIFQTKVEQLLLIFVIFSRLWPRFTGIQSNMEQIASAIPAFKAIIKLQQECIRTKEFYMENNPENKTYQPIEIKTHIECRNVSFRYNQNEQTYALKDINIHIPSRKMTAIVGRSGAGKSTLIDVIMGLIEPQTGEICIDGQPISNEKVYALRQSISYVPQDPFLFNGSIKDNLLMIDPNATEEQIWEALEFAASAEFVRKLPEGLDTLIGDRGIRLSGGERQRLVLARAILRKPSILILDEATSALDRENEAKIQEALERLQGRLTMIVIAHRMSTIRKADQVIVIDQGQIIQKGEYDQLAEEREGLFSNLLGNQIGAVNS
jgi:ABC-type multidrug transport system fused ATPase/permease subunit